MRRRATTALGIDLGERHIGVALVEKGPQGFRTLAAAGEDLSTPEPGQFPGKVLSRLLTQLGRWGRLRRTRAAVAVSSVPLLVRLLDLPEQVPANVGAFVTNELQQYVALSGKALVADFCGVGTGTQKRLLAAAGDADCLQALVSACCGAGIVVDKVEPALLAYVRAYLEHEKETRHAGSTLLALLGARTLTIGLLRQGTLDFIRTRDLPADASTPRLLCTWLADELKTVLCYLETQLVRADRARQVRVVLDDGRHRADEVAPLLAADPQTCLFTVVDAGVSTPGPRGAKEEFPARGGPSIAEGAALALLAVEGDDLKLNLLPKAVTEARSLFRHLLLTANLCVLVFLGIFVATQLLTRTTQALDRRIEESRISGEFYATPALIAQDKYLDQEIAGLRQRVDPLRKALGGRRPAGWPEIVQAIRQAAPTEVSVLQLQCDDGRTLSVTGSASSCPAAQAFVRALESRSSFASVLLATLQRQSEGNRFEYQIDCLLKAEGGPSL